MCWLAPSLSVEPTSRPSVHNILQQPFFLRLAAQEYLHAVAQEEAEARRAAGEILSLSASPERPSWLSLAHAPATQRLYRPSTENGSSSSSEGLPPLKPRAIDMLQQPLAGSFSEDYAHLDPEVVAEMEGLNMVTHRNSF